MTISRRTFLKSSTAALAGAAAGPSVASLDPNSFADRVFHATHYGPFEAIVREGSLIGLNSVAEIDARPSEMLAFGILDRTYDTTRIDYPMVRKSYLEGWASGDTKPGLRGREPFVRVDWDTAMQLAAKAILDVLEEHGNESIFSSSYGGWSHAGVMRPNVLQGRFFNLLGGCVNTQGDWSAGASQLSLPRVIGDMEVYSAQTAWEVIRDNTEVFVFVGCDPIKNNRVETNVADNAMHAHWIDIRDAGCRFVSINPQKTASDALLGSEWVPIVPNTDVALFLAMAHHVLEQGLEDRAYMERYTVGADRWIAYVQGEEDGVPKTPGWAEAITDIPAEKIRELAELFATSRTEIAGAWSLQRAQHGEMTHWAIINFAALIGKIGKTGEGVGFSWHYGNGGMPQSGKAGPTGLSSGRNEVTTTCPASRITEMLENPGMEYTHNAETKKYPDIRMIYNAGNNFISHQQDTNRLIKALQKVEHIVSQDVWWTAAVRWADIVLPASTTLERDDISSGGTYSIDKIYAMKKVIEPMGEAKSDYEIFRNLAAQFNLDGQFTDGLELMDHIRNAYHRTDATDDFETFWARGYAFMEVPAEARRWVRHGDFYDDPEANPLHTESGKIEMFCNEIAKLEIGDCPGMPVWIEKHEYLGTAADDQLHMVSPHPWYRLHSQMANSARLRALYMVEDREPVRLNRADAEARGIAEGDLVELYNDRGTVIAGAILSDEIRPGVVSLYEGAWPSLDSKGRCNSGLANFLTSTQRSSGFSQATTANSCLVRLRKCEDPEGPNKAYRKPEIIDDREIVALDLASLDIERIDSLTQSGMADMDPGEKLFYENCTACHVPRDPSHYTQRQWRGITPSMFPRAGLSEEEAALVTEFLMNNAADAGG